MCQIRIPLWLARKNKIHGVEHKGYIFFPCEIVSSSSKAIKVIFNSRVLSIPKSHFTVIQYFKRNIHTEGYNHIFIDANFIRNLKGVIGKQVGKYFSFNGNILGENERGYFVDVNGINYIVPKFEEKQLQTKIFPYLKDNIVFKENIYFYISNTSYRILEYDFIASDVIVEPFKEIVSWSSPGTPIQKNIADLEPLKLSDLMGSIRIPKQRESIYPFILDDSGAEIIDDDKIIEIYLDAVKKGMPKNAVPFIQKMILQQPATQIF